MRALERWENEGGRVIHAERRSDDQARFATGANDEKAEQTRGEGGFE